MNSIKRCFKRWFRRRKRPDIERFDFEDPPPDLNAIWHLGEEGSPDVPYRLRLDKLGEVWILGWVAPEDPRNVLGMGLQFNGKLMNQVSKDRLIPTVAFDLRGRVAVVSDDLPGTDDNVNLLCDKIQRRINGILDRWLQNIDTDTWHRVIAPLVSSSPRMRELIRTDPSYQKAAWHHHQFDTNGGLKTLAELHISSTSGSLIAYATTGLYPEHPMVDSALFDTFVFDLRQASQRSVANCMIEHHDGKLQFIDVLVPHPHSVLLETPELSRDESKLQEWFQTGLRASPQHVDIRVQVLPPDIRSENRIKDSPAIVTPGRTPEIGDPRSVFPPELDRDWVRTSILWLNPRSDLAKSILALPNDSEAVGHIPQIVHNYAAFFSHANFTQGWQLDTWKQVTQLVKFFGQIGKLQGRIAELQDRMAQMVSDPEEVEDLKQQLEEKEKELEERIRALWPAAESLFRHV